MFNKTFSWRIKRSLLFTLILILFFTNISEIYGYSDKFNLGLFSYQHGDYSKATTIFTEILKIKNTPKEEKLKTLELLGIISYINGNKAKSNKYFNLLLNIDSDYSLDPLFVPPEIVLFFNSIKNKKRELLQPLTYENKVSETTKNKTEIYKTLLKYSPFGLGYYTINKRKKGIIFSVSEALLLSLNVGLYYYRNCGMKECNSKYYDSNVVNEAKTIQIIQLASGYLWLALWGYNILDLNVRF